jgi:branched-chain amino acid aminotransferase
MKIWVDNALIESSADFIGAGGWPVGTGVFETIRTEQSRPQLLSRHMRRVLLSARELSISLPNEDDVLDAVDHLLRAERHELGRLRLSFSNEHFIATHERYLDSHSDMKVQSHRLSSTSSSRKHKTFPYSHNLGLLEEAKSKGVDEFLFIDSIGRVTEGAVSNFALRISGIWITPPITAGILPGVVRAIAISHCGVAVRDITEGDLATCDAAIAMSSLKIALPIASLNGNPLAIDDDTDQICLKLRELARTL